MALQGMNVGSGTLQGKGTTSELSKHPPVITDISTCRALLAIFMKDGKGSDINQHNEAVTT